MNEIKRDLPQEGETWRYYEGELYRIVGVGLNEIYNAPTVIYRSLRTLKLFARPVENFMAVNKNGSEYNFQKVGHAAPTEMALFIDLYSRLGIEVRIEKEGSKYFVFLPFGSVAQFNEAGEFISQYLGR